MVLLRRVHPTGGAGVFSGMDVPENTSVAFFFSFVSAANCRKRIYSGHGCNWKADSCNWQGDGWNGKGNVFMRPMAVLVWGVVGSCFSRRQKEGNLVRYILRDVFSPSFPSNAIICCMSDGCGECCPSPRLVSFSRSAGISAKNPAVLQVDVLLRLLRVAAVNMVKALILHRNVRIVSCLCPG